MEDYTYKCDVCEEEILERAGKFYCEECGREMCEKCWGTKCHEVTPASMYPRDGSAPCPAEYDKTMCDECYEEKARKAEADSYDRRGR